MGPAAARDTGGFSALMPIPNGIEGGIVPPHSVLAPESALGSVPTGALFSAQVKVDVGRARSARTGARLRDRHRQGWLSNAIRRAVRFPGARSCGLPT